MKMLQIPERTIRRHIKDRLLIGTKVGGVWKFTADDIKNYITNDKVTKQIVNNTFKEITDYYNGLILDKSEVIYMLIKEFKINASLEKFLDVTKLFEHKFSINGHGCLKSYRYTFKGQSSDVLILMKWSEEFEETL